MISTEISAASAIYLGSVAAQKMYIGSTLIWPQSGGQQEHDYSQDYFTIESLEDNNTISIGKNGSEITVYYSFDDGQTWNNVLLNSGKTIGTINTGEKILFKCTTDRWATSWNAYDRFNPNKNFKVYGNVMSLLNGDNYIDSEFANNTHNLCGLFYGTTTLVDASDLILPATTLRVSSYNGMFRGCSNLVYGPKLLPALDVPQDGYSSMFEGCVKLIEGPEIMATTVSGSTALNRMFCMNRNSKVTAAMTKSPILRITNPAAYANTYQQLFCGNGNITEVTMLAPNGNNLSFTSWLANTSASGVIKKLASTTLQSGVSGVPSGWTTETYSEDQGGASLDPYQEGGTISTGD